VQGAIAAVAKNVLVLEESLECSGAPSDALLKDFQSEETSV